MNRRMSLKQFGGTVMAAMALSTVAMSAAPAEAGITAHFSDTTFNTTLANLGLAPWEVDFDDFTLPDEITGLTLHRGPAVGGVNINFGRLGASAPLWVMPANHTLPTTGFTPAANLNAHRLRGTSTNASGIAWILSPGGPLLAPGPNPLMEQDDLVLTFSPNVRHVGLDLLFQSLDGNSLVRIDVYGPGGVLIYQNLSLPIPGVAGAPAGHRFFGVTTDGPTSIWRVVINEYDSDAINQDSNIGFDTIRVR